MVSLLQDLQRWTLSDFDKLRRKGIHTLVDGLRRFPDGIDFALTETLKVLDNPESTDKQVTGALWLLSNEQLKVWAVNKYRRLSNLARTICGSGEQHKDDKVQTALHNLFLHIFSSLSATPLSFPTIASSASSSSTLTAAQIEARNAGIREDNATQLSHYEHLIEKLVTFAEPGAHWRYQLMATAFLVALIRPNTSNPDMVMTIFRGMLSLHFSIFLLFFLFLAVSAHDAPC